jgi:putative DNA primase/helicase
MNAETKVMQGVLAEATPFKVKMIGDSPKLLPLLKPVSVFDVLTNPAPPPQFVWEGLLPRGVVSLMGAHGGTGKSTIALMLGVCTVLGRPLFGIDTEPCKVLFVSLEDGVHIVRHRLAGICRAWNIDPAQLHNRLHIVDGTEHPELFAAETRGAGEITASYFELRKIVQSENIGLVLVDNASDAFGGDEVQRRQVRAFMRSLNEVARLTDCAVMLLAHVDKNTSRNKRAEGGEGYSGSTAWHNSARSRLFLTRGDDGLLTLEHQKSNLGRMREPLTLNWLEGGFPQLVEGGGFDNSLHQGRVDDDRAAALLRLIAEFESRGQYCSPAPTARNNVFAMLRSEPGFQKLKLNSDATKRIVNQCQRAKWIEPTDYKSAHTRKYCQRWALTPEGYLFAGLPAPTAPTTPTSQESAVTAEGALCGAPTAPTYTGGVGEIARTEQGAKGAGNE